MSARCEPGARRPAGPRYVAVAIAVMLAEPAHALDAWSAKILNACTSIQARSCMLKPETRICPAAGGACRSIGPNNYVAVRAVRGSQIVVDTSTGRATAPMSMLVYLPRP